MGTNKDQETRIRILEQFKWQLTGGLIFLNLISGTVIYLALHHG